MDMPPLELKRIHLGSKEATRQLANLRGQLSASGNIVSPRGRELTTKVFGEPLPPNRVVERVYEDVRKRGREALLHYTEKFDGVALTPDNFRVARSEMALAHAAADLEFLDAVRRVRQNISTFQSGLLHRSATLSVAGKH